MTLSELLEIRACLNTKPATFRSAILLLDKEIGRRLAPHVSKGTAIPLSTQTLVHSLRAKGKTLSFICNATGYSLSTIHNILNRKKQFAIPSPRP